MKKLINLPNCQTIMRYERNLTWGRRVPALAFVSQGSMP